MQAPRPIAAPPPVSSTYELVQRFLLIGKLTPHSIPAPNSTTPAPASARTLRTGAADDCIHTPASAPRSVVATAGAELRRPSGSQSRRQRWPPNSARSTRAPMSPPCVTPPVHRAPRARVVHDGHPGHGDAAERVERDQPCPGGGRGPAPFNLHAHSLYNSG